MSGVLVTGFNALARLPVIFAGCNATLLVGEAVYRTIGIAFGTFGFTGQNQWMSYVNEKIPSLMLNLRPFEKLTYRQLATSGVACIVITTLGWEIVNKLAGKAPNLYNTINNWVSPLQLNSKWRHPAVQFLVDTFKGTKKPALTE